MVGNDAIDTFQAKTLPPGSAPPESTFKPNNISDVPPVANMSNKSDPEAPQTKASDTIQGATSGDVHTGLGHPGQGQSSKELHDGSKSGGMGGPEGVGGTAPVANLVDAHQPEHADQRALNKDDAKVGRGSAGGDAAQDRGGAAAQDRIPESADTVAAESRS